LPFAHPAAAHSDIVRTEPADGAVLKHSPNKIILWFEKDLDTFESAFELVDTNGEEIDLGRVLFDQTDRGKMEAVLPEDLPPGIYSVHWTAVDDQDAHPITGQFSFTIAGIQEANKPQNAILSSYLPIFLILVIVGGFWFRKQSG
jgi:methionine-rich copper-binding protein CopC